jgi:hypothetical protein
MIKKKYKKKSFMFYQILQQKIFYLFNSFIFKPIKFSLDIFILGIIWVTPAFFRSAIFIGGFNEFGWYLILIIFQFTFLCYLSSKEEIYKFSKLKKLFLWLFFLFFCLLISFYFEYFIIIPKILIESSFIIVVFIFYNLWLPRI